MIRKIFCAALIALGITLDTYFYAFRFIADGLPAVVAIAAGVALEMLLSFAVWNTRRSKVFVVIAVAITVYAVVQTSAGQTFALLSHTASIGVETETGTASFTMAQCKENVARLTEEANIITGQLKSLQSVKARVEYAGTISRANERLNQITRERTRLMDVLLKTSAATVTDARDADNQKSIYNFYAGMVNWQKDDWLKFVFHFFLSVLLAIMAPVGILSWGHSTVTSTPEFSRQQIEMFVAAAWYRVRNNTGSTVLSEVAYNELLQKRGHPVETGVYFALMNKCMQCGLVNTGGFALEKDHKKVIEKLSGERPAAQIAIKNKLQKIKEYVAAFVSAHLKKIIVILIFATAFISCNAPGVKPWPGGNIPFVIVNLSHEESAIVLKSMLEWEIASGGKIKFTLSENIGDGIVYICKVNNAPDWFGGLSSRGFSSKYMRKILLSVIDKKVALHELGHTIGLEDDYIDKSSIMYFEYYSSLNEGHVSPPDAQKVSDMYKDVDLVR